MGGEASAHWGMNFQLMNSLAFGFLPDTNRQLLASSMKGHRQNKLNKTKSYQNSPTIADVISYFQLSSQLQKLWIICGFIMFLIKNIN